MQTYARHADWLCSEDALVHVIGHRKLSPAIHLSRVLGTGFFEDPPTPDVTVQFVLGGACRFPWVDNGFGRFAGTCGAGSFVVTAPHCPTTGSGTGSYDSLVVAIQWADTYQKLQSVNCDVSDLGALHRGFHNDATAVHLLQMLAHEQIMDGAHGTLFADGVTTALVARLLQLGETPLPQIGIRVRGLGKSDLKRVTDYIGDNLAGDISLDALAGVVAVSPFHFCRLFKKSTGLSPHQYVIRARLEQAESLLRRGSTLTQAAHRVGFSDAAHLSRHRKRRAGASSPTS